MLAPPLATGTRETLPLTGWVTAEPSTLMAFVSCTWSRAMTTRRVPGLLLPLLTSAVVPATWATLVLALAGGVVVTVPATVTVPVTGIPTAAIERSFAEMLPVALAASALAPKGSAGTVT